MRREPLWIRALQRLGREMSAFRHVREDSARLRAFQAHGVSKAGLITPEEFVRVVARLGHDAGSGGRTASDEGGTASEELDDRPSEVRREEVVEAGLVLPRAPSVALEEWSSQHPDWNRRAIDEAEEVRHGRVTLYGLPYLLEDPQAWNRDPLRDDPWPDLPHSLLRLDAPDRSGDVRMQWEAARFHHGILLGRAWLATRDPIYPESFLRQFDSFQRGCHPFRTIHWAVGMEVAIRAVAWVLALEFLRGAPALTQEWREQLVRALLVHGLFLEHHLERHPLGFTTNHTTSDHAGLAVLGRFFSDTETGRRWQAIAWRGLLESFSDQVLAGGAHAEASLQYERYVLEAALLAALCLEPGRETLSPEGASETFRSSIRLLAHHLRSACLTRGLPSVGDGDESFFPPFGFLPFAQRDPQDPEPILQAAAAWLEEPGLRSRAETEEAAFWLGAPLAAPLVAAGVAPSDGRSFDRLPGTGFVRFADGPFLGLLLTRNQEEGWRPTHGHNDLLSLVLDVDGEPLLIDPGTGGYGWNRRLRHWLRSTAAHSTLQVEDREQSPLRERALFEGPRAVGGGVELPSGSSISRPEKNAPSELGLRLNLRSWHDGFGPELRHTRRLRFRAGHLWIEDRLGPEITRLHQRRTGSGSHAGPGSARAKDEIEDRLRSGVSSTLRFRLGGGLRPTLEVLSGSSRQSCAVPLPTGTVRFLFLHPRNAPWQIGAGPASRRYASQEELPILEATMRGPLPHRWVTALRFTPRS